MKIWRLRHLHMACVRGEIDRTFTQNDGMRHVIHFCLQGHTFCQRVVHAALHESALPTTVLHVFHVMRHVGGLFLCRDSSRHEQTNQPNFYCAHKLLLRRLSSLRITRLHHISSFALLRDVTTAGGR